MHPVLELDRTTEFHHETPIALVTHMQIPIHTTKQYSRIIPNPQIQF